MGLLVLISLWTMSAVALPAAGATRCPAAVSATVFTSACMVSGGEDGRDGGLEKSCPPRSCAHRSYGSF